MSSPSISLILVFSNSNIALFFWYDSLFKRSLIPAEFSIWNTSVRILLRISSNCSRVYFFKLTVVPNCLNIFSRNLLLDKVVLKSPIFMLVSKSG